MEISLKSQEYKHDPTTPLLGIYPEKTIIERDICTLMFIATLFARARALKQPRSPLTDEWIKRLWYTYTMEYYSAIKRKIFESVLRWMNLEPVIKSELSQKEKNKYHVLKHMYGIQKYGTDEPICTAAVEMQMQRTDWGTQLGKEKVGQMERVAWKHIHYCM